MALQFNPVLESKQMYHVWTYCCYPPAYAQQGTCLNLMIDLKTTESAMGGMTLDSASSTGTEEQDTEDGWRKIQMSKQRKVEQIRNEAALN